MGKGVRERVYGVVQGVWLRAGLAVGRDRGTGGLWYGVGWAGLGYGYGVGQESRAGWVCMGVWGE